MRNAVTKMISIDTNVLIRIVIDDDHEQADLARVLFRENLSDVGVRIPLIVLVESVWVLKKRYGRTKVEILHFLERLITIPGISVERRTEVENAITHWRNGTADFTDYIILAASEADGCTTTYTFEKKKMGRDPRATILSRNS